MLPAMHHAECLQALHHAECLHCVLDILSRCLPWPCLQHQLHRSTCTGSTSKVEQQICFCAIPSLHTTLRKDDCSINLTAGGPDGTLCLPLLPAVHSHMSAAVSLQMCIPQDGNLPAWTGQQQPAWRQQLSNLVSQLCSCCRLVY